MTAHPALLAARLALVSGLALLTSACLVGPDYKGPPKMAELNREVFTRAAIATATSDQPVELWWKKLGDPQLDALIARAFDNNRNLAEARANLRASRAVLQGSQQEFLPGGGLNASYTRQRFSEEALIFGGQGDDFSIPDQDLYAIGADTRWEIDLFGRIRRGVQAARTRAEAAEAVRDDLLVSVAAEVATAYVALRGAQKRLAVAERNAANQEDSFKLTQVLLRGGRGTKLDVERARGQLANTLATIPPLKAEFDVQAHRLGVLTGDGPTALREELSPSMPIPRMPTLIGVGSPADLFRRRPDIRAAERELAAATADIGIQTADYFPTVSLVGSGGFQSNTTGNLLQSSALQFTLGPQLIWNLLDFTRIRARVKEAGARAEAAAARYEQTVLLAFEETENALTLYGNELLRREQLGEARDATREAARLARLRYDNGIDDFLAVLDAERVALISEDARVVSEVEATLQEIAIYRALGGGWQTQAEAEAKSQ
ncbi:efflux transporter outer membrane subunit [Alterisphingorhabdus coralli]|uniref:Efflux transporter outer membrane subunit n=1 Tax=Alterisphingorhabdus coralli TaxID=3071408 RepID=A0AA97I0T6_9SPHN|nr:efflux transporter outer membrane subunit [Parasphingorhabdus sp. SCSIO 66989]WOE74673.1 efflux transporter outer membrane subunit [Parasphingorhabdus sp. SCSIO 66989]